MKMKLFLILILSQTLLLNANDNPLTKRKVPQEEIADDRTTYHFIGEFQVSLTEDEEYLIPLRTPEEIREAKPYYLLRGMPAIGIYGDPYNFRNRFALIKLSPKMMAPAMPEQLRQQLIRALAPGKTIDQALHGKIVYAQIMVTGQTQDKKPGPFNMVFHPFAYTFNNKKKSFSNNISMGIFNADGVNPTPKGITFNRFQGQNVTPHPGKDAFALSPDNAKFNITPGRAVSTFWSAAYSPNKQYVTITYHILANTDAMQTEFADIFQQSDTLADVLTRLQLQAEQISDPDKQALENAIETIRSMVTPQEIDPLDVLEQQLASLAQSLEQLNEQLSQLS